MEDPRSVTALDVAERYANGAASNDELAAASDAARPAAWDAAWAAAWATQAAELKRICAEMAAGRDPYPAAGVIA